MNEGSLYDHLAYTCSMLHKEIIDYLQSLTSPEIAAHSRRFFKTGKGEYAEGDVFLGIRVPIIRQAVRKFTAASVQDVETLLASQYHEVRLFAVLLLVAHFHKAKPDDQQVIYQLYLNNTQSINNWDLVDSSAHHIVGGYLFDKDRAILRKLAQSDLLWDRRIAIIATYYFIKQAQYADTLEIANCLLNDAEDLIHKAVGWMLREVGKRDRAVEEAFLKRHYQRMPRTMLRYAIEKFSPQRRKQYLQGLA